MIVFLRHLLDWIVSAVSSRGDLILENLALRQQLLPLHDTRPGRRLTASHRSNAVWVASNCEKRWPTNSRNYNNLFQ